MIRKYILSIFAIALFSLEATTTLQAQTVSIDNDVFTKCFIEHTSKGAILKSELELEYGDELLYFDNEYNIRKYVSDFQYPESRFLVSAAYDMLGRLTSVIFNTSTPGGTPCCGTIIIAYDDLNNPIFDYVIYHSKSYDELLPEVNLSVSFPDTGEDFNISDYINISNLLKTVDLKNIDILKDCYKVTFRRPQKGDLAMLNAVEAGWKVQIIDVEVNENGEKRYLVEYRGKHEYFPDSALEDIEVIISKE